VGLQRLGNAFYIYHDKRKIHHAYECKWSALEPDLANFRAFRQAYPQGNNYLVVPQRGAAQVLRREGLVVQVNSPADWMPKLAEG
jgi:hypothetical protein